MGLAFSILFNLMLHINITCIVLFRALARCRIISGAYYFPHITKY